MSYLICETRECTSFLKIGNVIVWRRVRENRVVNWRVNQGVKPDALILNRVIGCNVEVLAAEVSGFRKYNAVLNTNCIGRTKTVL